MPGPSPTTKGRSVLLSSGQFSFRLPLLSIESQGGIGWSFGLDYLSQNAPGGILGDGFNFPQNLHLELDVTNVDVHLLTGENTEEIFLGTVNGSDGHLHAGGLEQLASPPDPDRLPDGQRRVHPPLVRRGGDPAICEGVPQAAAYNLESLPRWEYRTSCPGSRRPIFLPGRCRVDRAFLPCRQPRHNAACLGGGAKGPVGEPVGVRRSGTFPPGSSGGDSNRSHGFPRFRRARPGGTATERLRPNRGNKSSSPPGSPRREQRLRTGAEIGVVFRSAKERGFRGAKGDNTTVIDAPVLTSYSARPQSGGKSPM